MSNVPFWHAPWTFVVHGFVGTSIFTIIGGCAVALEQLVIWAEKTYPTSRLIYYGLVAAENVLFFTDLILFAVFLWCTARRAINDMARQ